LEWAKWPNRNELEVWQAFFLRAACLIVASFKQAVDQVQVARTATPGTNGERASQMGFRAGRKSRGLFRKFDAPQLSKEYR